MLNVESVTMSFGGLLAVREVSLSLPEGVIASLIGPNGAGKTTLFSIISGFLQPSKGKVWLRDRDITNMPAHRVCRLGLVRTFQVVQPFAQQTVVENIAVGAHLRVLGRTDALEKAREVASRVGMTRWLDREAQGLPIAARKRLELARALATDPQLILLDEVLAGLNPTEIDEIVPLIRAIRDGGVTILLIEHVMRAVMKLSEHTWVIGNGEIIAAGRPRDVAADPRVIAAYLGRGMAERLATEGGNA